MGNSYSLIYLHFVFSTKERRSWINDEIRPSLHAYMARIVNEEFGQAREVGGTDNHMHLLLDMQRIASPDAIMRTIKSRTSKWMKGETDNQWFGWQDGYGVFSVSASAVDRVGEYIRDQKEHHQRWSFSEEFGRLLQKHGVAYDPKYLV